MSPVEIYKVKNGILKDVQYIKVTNVEKREKEFIIYIKCIPNSDTQTLNGEEFFDMVQTGKITIASNTDKAKLLLSHKGF